MTTHPLQNLTLPNPSNFLPVVCGKLSRVGAFVYDRLPEATQRPLFIGLSLLTFASIVNIPIVAVKVTAAIIPIIGGLVLLSVLVSTLLRGNSNEIDRTLLDSATLGDRRKVLFSLAAGANVNQADPQNRTIALISAVRGRHLEIIRDLISAGADLNHAVENNATALMWAIATGQIEIVRILIAAGANVNQAAQDRRSPLMFAIAGQWPEIVQELLATPEIDINFQDVDGETALILAARHGYTEIIRSLLSNGANLNVRATDSKTAILIAAENGHTDVVQALIAAGVDVNQATTHGKTSLMLAASGNFLETVQAVIAVQGISINQKDINNVTALMWAARYRATPVVKILATTPGIKVNEKDSNGRTALHWAKQYNLDDMIAALVAAGATSEPESPLDLDEL